MARNIVHMALPMTVAQLINILYNVVDRMYLGRLPGHLALTGLGLCLPIISILMAFANLCGMGGAPLCSIHRGRGENGEAERIMGNSFALLLLFGAGLTVLCLAFRRPILYLFGASDVTFPYANDYLTIYVLGTVFVMIGLGMNPFINSQGFSGMGMLTVALGASGFAMSMTNSLVQVLCNASLQVYGGDLYVGVMTVINSVREVVSMPVQGITNGCQPVLGYNYGAGEYGRVREGIRFTTVLTVGYSLAAWALVMAVPELLIRIFNSEADLIAAGIPAFRIYFAAFFCMSFQFIGQSVFVGLGRSKNAVFFSLLRKAFIVAPLTLLLPALGMGVNGVFLAEPISNVLGGLACILTMYATVYRPLGRQ